MLTKKVLKPLDNKKVEKRVLPQNDHVILKYSEITNDYPWLYKMLNEHDVITDSVLNQLSPSERLVYDSMLTGLIGRAIEEWEGDEVPIDDLGEDRVHCSLCNTENKFVFIITNRINGKTLNVGSSCIAKFGDIKFGKDKKTIQQILHERKRNKRKEDLIKNVPNVLVVENWYNASDYPILIPSYLTETFVRLGDNARKLYNDYLDGKKNAEVFPELIQLIAKRESYLLNFMKYVDANIDKPFVVTREFAEWANFYLDLEWRAKLYETGYINWGIACRFTEPKFMKSLIPEVNAIIKDSSAKIKSADASKKVYVVKPLADNDIIIYCPYKDIVTNFAGPIFGTELDEPVTLEKLTENAIFNDDRSLLLASSAINDQLKKQGYYIYDPDVTTDEAYIYDSEINKYVRIRLTSFLNSFMKHSLGLKGSNVNDLIQYIKGLPGKRYTKNEIDDIDSIDSIMRENPFTRNR